MSNLELVSPSISVNMLSPERMDDMNALRLSGQAAENVAMHMIDGMERIVEHAAGTTGDDYTFYSIELEASKAVLRMLQESCNFEWLTDEEMDKLKIKAGH